MKYLRLVGSNLSRKKFRTILTLLSILVAFILFGFLSAVRQALSQGVDVAGADRLVVRNKVSLIQPLPVSYQAQIEQLKGVDLVTHANWFGGIYRDAKNFFPQIVVVPEKYLELYPEIVLPEAEKKAWLATRTGAIVGRSTARRFGWKVGDKIPLQSTFVSYGGGKRNWEFDLVGIFDGSKKGTDTSRLFFRYDYFDEARDVGKGLVGWYILRVHDPEDAAQVARRIDEQFANSPYETKAETEGAFVQAFASQVGNIGAIMVAILSAVFFTILLVAGNTMAQSVRERVGELAVLKALGFTDLQVLGLVLAEALTIAGLGGLLGLALVWSIISFWDAVRAAMPLFYLTTRDVLVGIVLVFALGVITGILPALQAGRLRVADALRRLA